MPRVLDAAKMAHAAELYASGKTFKQVASELSMDPESLRAALIRRGVEPRTRAYRSPGVLKPAPPGLVESYLSGVSEKSLAEQHGVSRAVVARWLRENNVQRRTVKEASVLYRASLAGSERSALAAAAHEARRGQTNTEVHQCRIAKSRERSGYGGRTSRGAEWLSAALTEIGVTFIREKAVGRYNVDLALPQQSVAVEVLGGNWHGYKPVHRQRTPYILNRGWHMLFIWDQKRVPLGPQALSYLLSFLDEAGGLPARRCEYRVIRGDGELVTFGGANDDEFPLVPPSEAKLG